MVVVVAVVLLAVSFAVLVGEPVVLLGLDLLWLVLVLIAGTAGRVVLRRPWRVEDRSDDDRRDRFVNGFRAAARVRDELAEQFRHGSNPSPADPSVLPD